LPNRYNSFAEIGLTDTEGRIFGSLIENGPATGSAMAMRLGINKSVAYFVLEQLLQKELVFCIVINKKKQYHAIDSKLLKSKVGERKELFMKNLGSINAILEITQKKKNKATFSIFEGFDGMKIAFDDIILTMKDMPKEEYIVFAVDVPEKIFPRFRRFIRKFHLSRSSQNITCKLLIASRLRSTLGIDRKGEAHTSVRFVSSEHSMPVAANVYCNKVLLAVWTTPPVAFIIEDKDVADSFRALFNLLWKTGKP